MLFTTKNLKKIFKRDRPLVPKPGAPNRRDYNLRDLENNHSFPSGDTAQAANLVCFFALNVPKFYESLGGIWFAVIYVSLVALARVYYHCHYFGDTIFGAMLGYPLNYLIKVSGFAATCSRLVRPFI